MNDEEIRYIVRDELRKILDKGLMYSAETKPKPQKEAITPQAVAEAFPPDLRQYLTITENTIKNEYVSPEKFAQISAIAEKLGYKRIVDGKNSRWEK